ncbi:hypothetical protein BCR37DRAFT_26354 [Protomyces lactucae-debilis]|uniref:Uncharacterized protein n=1 Tax=Protomyces lactucae-debilis TaxID=2754530 RepID=A0A1Y2FF92_PROLT|nr:uncharacterized protein BCR37DRAFT_26354 [Protomyces lactucae-debilis]ORY81956.1 hypothetical protein BCR37DRAFT_26354 [Protomyces lactucae-debilis]
MSDERGSIDDAMQSIEAAPVIKQRTRYKHSDYVCEKCRRAHRRCKHDPRLDPNYDPNKPRKRKRHDRGDDADGAGQSSVASLQQTASEEGSMRLESVPNESFLLDELTPTVSLECPLPPPATEIQDPTSERHIELLTHLIQAFSICPPSEVHNAQWRQMLQDSEALRTAVLSLTILQSPLHSERLDEALGYKHTAVTLQLSEPSYDSDYYAHCTPLFISLLLCLCEFASQSPLEVLALHASQSRLLLDGYLAQDALPDLFTQMMMPSLQEDCAISKRLLERHPSIATPFLFVFPGIDIAQDCAVGNVQDLLGLALTGYALALRPPGAYGHAVLRLMFRVCLHVIHRDLLPSAQQRFADLMVETLYVLATWLEYYDRPHPGHLRMSLCAKIEVVEHFFGTMVLPRAVVDLLDGRPIVESLPSNVF